MSAITSSRCSCSSRGKIPKSETPGSDIRNFRFFASIKAQSARRESCELGSRRNAQIRALLVAKSAFSGVGVEISPRQRKFFCCWRVRLSTEKAISVLPPALSQRRLFHSLQPLSMPCALSRRAPSSCCFVDQCTPSRRANEPGAVNAELLQDASQGSHIHVRFALCARARQGTHSKVGESELPAASIEGNANTRRAPPSTAECPAPSAAAVHPPAAAAAATACHHPSRPLLCRPTFSLPSLPDPLRSAIAQRRDGAKSSVVKGPLEKREYNLFLNLHSDFVTRN